MSDLELARNFVDAMMDSLRCDAEYFHELFGRRESYKMQIAAEVKWGFVESKLVNKKVLFRLTKPGLKDWEFRDKKYQ